MIRQAVPQAITKEGLLGKSKVYVQRAFRAKLADDFDEYQLWASLALELLAKAALSSIHPSLVVDPQHYESLFAASGLIVSTDIKTIGASTLYKRVAHLSKYFDIRVQKFCDAISLRRNSELHSGEAPFQQMRLDAWEGRYWHAAQVVLVLLNLTLEEWIGTDQAQAPKELVKAAKDATIQAATQRVEQARDHFNQRTKADRDAAIRASKTRQSYNYPGLFKLCTEHDWEVECPACQSQAFLGGFNDGESIIEESVGEEGIEEEVEKYYHAEEFRCPVCDLHLDGRDEIEAAGMEPDVMEVETREREYEPDYGNC